jgi:hypothetical protein
MSLEAELLHHRNRIEDTSRALKIAEWTEKKALELIMDSLQDEEDMILQEMDLVNANKRKSV